MALNDSAVLTPAKGYIFTAAADTAAPSPAVIEAFTSTTPGLDVAWDSIGHTSREDLPEFGFDGGDSDVKGTWQNEALKTVITSAAIDFVTFNVHQFDEATLNLYYGTTNASSTVGQYSVAGSPGGVTRKALLIVIVDGTTNIAFYAPRVDIRRNDSLSLAVDSFAAMPLRATFIGGGAVLFSWISSDTGVNPT
jgi:hypothetical protein